MMSQCFREPIIRNVNVKDIFKRIRCFCTCCGGSVIIYQSELDGNSEETTPPRHQDSFNTVYIPSKIVRNIKDKSVLTKSETKDYRVVYNKRVIVHNYYTLPYGFY